MKRKNSKRFGWMMATAIMGLFGAGISRGFVIGEFDFGILEDEPGRVDVALSPGDKTRDSLIVPETVVIEGKEYRVKKVREEGFALVTSPYVRLPESMILGRAAFSHSNLGALEVEGMGLDSVSDRAFWRCKIPRLDCNILPRDYAKIENMALVTETQTKIFYKIEVEDLIWSQWLPVIGSRLFESSRIHHVHFPPSLKEITFDAFYQVNNLDSIVIPDSVTLDQSFPGAAFNSSLTLGKGCVLRDKAFLSNIMIKRLVIPSGTVLKDDPFPFWMALEEVDFAGDIDFKGAYDIFRSSYSNYPWSPYEVSDCFQPDIWRQISHNFDQEPKPLRVIYRTSNPQEVRGPLFNDDTYDAGCLYVEDDGVEKARQTRPWSKFKIILPLSQYNGVEGVTPDGRPDGDWPEEVFTLDGTRVPGRTDALPPGTYIVRRGPKVTKLRI